MAHDTNNPNTEPASSGKGIGCLVGIIVAIAIPAVVFCGILIGNSRNPQCGTPADEGGCEMGLVSGTIGAIVAGLVAGLLVWAVIALWQRSRPKPD